MSVRPIVELLNVFEDALKKAEYNFGIEEYAALQGARLAIIQHVTERDDKIRRLSIELIETQSKLREKEGKN